MSTSSSEALVGRVKAVHRRFPTGVTVVTTWGDDCPHGLAVNAFSSISLGPPTVLVCVARTSITHRRLQHAAHIAINILAHDQAAVAAAFARSGGDKFAGIAWRGGQHGSPLIDGASAHLELEVAERLTAYSHTIFIGRVVDACVSDRPPLVYLAGDFYDGGDLRPAASVDGPEHPG